MLPPKSQNIKPQKIYLKKNKVERPFLNFVKKTIFSAFVLVGFFSISEGISRLLFLKPNQPVGLKEKMTELANKQKFDFRDVENVMQVLPQALDKKKYYTILLLGESFVAGTVPDYKQKISYYLEDLLNRDLALRQKFKKKFLVINGGIHGASSKTLVDLYRSVFKKFLPDQVLMIAAYNDHYYANAKKDFTMSYRVKKFLYSHSFLVFGLASWLKLQSVQNPYLFMRQFQKKIDISDYEFMLRQYAHHLNLLIEEARSIDTQVMLGLQPLGIPEHLTELQKLNDEITVKRIEAEIDRKEAIGYWEALYFLQSKLIEEALKTGESENCSIVDLRYLFQGHVKDFYLDEIHINARGNMRVAETIFQAFRKETLSQIN